jgi:hypothetical protein
MVARSRERPADEIDLHSSIRDALEECGLDHPQRGAGPTSEISTVRDQDVVAGALRRRRHYSSRDAGEHTLSASSVRLWHNSDLKTFGTGDPLWIRKQIL